MTRVSFQLVFSVNLSVVSHQEADSSVKEAINSLLKDHIAVLSSNKSSEDGESYLSKEEKNI